TAFADRLGGVDDQVQRDLADLGGVGLGRRQLGGQLETQRDCGGEAGAEQLGELHDQRADVDKLRCDLALARVGQDLAGQAAGALRRDYDLRDAQVGGRVRCELVQGQLGVAQDGSQQGVPVVGDAAGQHAQSCQLLGV